MDKKKLLGIGIAVAAAAYLLWNKVKQDVFGLKFNVAGIQSVTITDGVKVVMSVRINNPSATPFPLYSTTLSGIITANNAIVLGTASGSANTMLAPYSSIVVPVEVVINPLSLDLSTLAALMTGSGVSFVFNGNITVSGVTSPLYLEYKVL